MVKWRAGLMLAVLMLSGGMAPNAHAGDIARSFVELQATEQPGRMVELFGTNGKRTRGRVLRVTSSAIVLRVDETARPPVDRTFPEPEVREIRRHHSRWKGGLIGLGVGLGLAVGLCQADGECGARARTMEPVRHGAGVSPSHVAGPLMLASVIAGPVIGRALDRPRAETIYLAR